jgi:hypothetical protein
MRTDEVLERLSAMGAAAQASVPGVYAWGVTVAPSAWARGSSLGAKVAAITALLMLGAGVVGDGGWQGSGRWGRWARLLSFWGFVLASAATWSLSRAGLASLRMDSLRGLAGMLGWSLFAFASAAPALGARTQEGGEGREHAAEGPPLGPHRKPAFGDAFYVAGGAVAAGALEVFGWRIASPERALLARFIALATGLAIIGAAVEIALARHVPRTMTSRSRRLRRAMAALVTLGVLVLAGLLLLALD